LRLQNYLFFFIRQNFIAFSFPFFRLCGAFSEKSVIFAAENRI